MRHEHTNTNLYSLAHFICGYEHCIDNQLRYAYQGYFIENCRSIAGSMGENREERSVMRKERANGEIKEQVGYDEI